jgi:hypothetical protein
MLTVGRRMGEMHRPWGPPTLERRPQEALPRLAATAAPRGKGREIGREEGER